MQQRQIVEASVQPFLCRCSSQNSTDRFQYDGERRVDRRHKRTEDSDCEAVGLKHRGSSRRPSFFFLFSVADWILVVLYYCYWDDLLQRDVELKEVIDVLFFQREFLHDLPFQASPSWKGWSGIFLLLLSVFVGEASPVIVETSSCSE